MKHPPLLARRFYIDYIGLSSVVMKVQVERFPEYVLHWGYRVFRRAGIFLFSGSTKAQVHLPNSTTRAAFFGWMDAFSIRLIFRSCRCAGY